MPITKPKSKFDTAGTPFQEAQAAIFEGAGTNPGGVQDNLPLVSGPSMEEEAVAKQQRQEKATFGDNLGSMWNQDSFANGLVAHIAGQQMTPDPKWNPWDEQNKQYLDGLNDQEQLSMSDTRSEAHAIYVRQLLLDKREDQQRLADLGGWGTAGRLAFGAVAPDQLLASMLGGRVAQVVKYGRTALASAEVASQVPSKLTPLASGIAGGAGFNATFEAVRQKYNFENDSTGVLQAALMGGALAVPFSLLHIRDQSRIANTSSRASAAFEAVAAHAKGEEVSPHLAEQFKQSQAEDRVAKAIDQGHMTEDDAVAAMEHPEGYSGSRDLTVYHGTKATELEVPDAKGLTKSWDFGYGHFSTDPDTAKFFADHGGTPGRVLEGRVNPGKALEMRDMAGWESGNVASELDRMALTASKEDGHGNLGEMGTKVLRAMEAAGSDQDARVAAGNQVLRDWFAAKGYDSIKYKNEFEGKPVDTYMVVNPKSLRAGPAPAESPFMKGSVGSAQVAPVTGMETAFSKARFDIYATLNRSENPHVREIGNRLIKDAIQVDSHEAQGWTASESKSDFVRRYKGEASSEMASAYKEAKKASGLNILQRTQQGFEDNFHSLVTRVVRGDTQVLADNPAIAPMLSRAAKAVRGAYDNMLAEAAAHGVKGTDTLTPHDNYVNRQWDHEKIRKMEELHGPQAVRQLVAGAIKVPGFTGDLEKATKFLKAVKSMEFSNTMQDVMLHGQDMGTLRDALGKHNKSLTQGDIDSIVDTMFEQQAKKGEGDKGTTPRLKYRFDLDETHTITTKAGDLRISDLLENDARYLMDSYFNTMAGHTGMAKLGIKSKADWDAKMADARGWFDDNATKGGTAKRDLRYLEDIYSNITGKPMSTQEFSTTARIAAGVRAYTRAASLGQLGFAAALETKQAMALFGTKAMFQHMPSLKETINGLRTGHINNKKFAKDVEAFLGFGHEMSMSYARHAEIEEAWGHRALNGFENFGNKAGHAVDILSGNAGLTAMTRNWSAQAYIQKVTNMAHGGTVSPKWRERMVGWGVDDQHLDGMLAKLKEHSDVEPGSGRVNGINYEDWARDDIKSYERFRLSATRAARDAIQDHDLGETMMFMHSTLGKVFAELKTFMLVGHAKNMLKNAHYRDSTALQVYSIGLLGEVLGYVSQTVANFPNNQAELDKRLAVDRIAKAAFARMSSAGIVPLVADFGNQVVTGESLFGAGSTVNTDNRTLIPPSLTMVGRAYNAPSTLIGMLTGRESVTQKNVKDMASILPGARLLGVTHGINALAEMFPKNAPVPVKK